ncbi:MAG: alpha/beta hydrolase, partial [Anaerolineae bacterium]|nr:alpha/beta hydrolase [Anaerolineae bacterium]
MRAQSLDQLRTCHDRLAADGVDFSIFSSAASAADIQDIRKVLGYDQVNLYGISYGTRLALTTMRDHPEGIRSVILDSVYPPNVDLTLDGAVNTQAIFDKVFAACAADSTCSEQYPDLETVFYEVVDELNAQPVEVKLPPRTLPMDGDGFMGALYNWLYNAAIIPEVPGLIYQLKAGDSSGLNAIIRFTMPLPGMSYPMSNSVQCQEEFPFTDQSQLASRLSALKPALRDWVQSNYETGAAICDFWGVPALNPVENEAVVSDIPALVLSGEYDPITPPSFGKLAARTLNHSYEIEIPATGHGALIGNLGLCAVLAAEDFLNDPTQAPENTCPAAMPFQFS